MKKQLLTLGLISIGACLWAQSPGQKQPVCGTRVPSKQWDAWFNTHVDTYKAGLASGKTQATNYTIPVIVHVIHGSESAGTFPNLSQAQINSQIAVLNQDYSGSSFNVGNLASTGFSLVGAANCNITFCLATRDTAGALLPEPGIDRINYVTKGWADPASINNPMDFLMLMDTVIKPATIWNVNRYLNIWVSDCNFGMLGYATFPAGAGLTGLALPGTDLGTGSNDGVYCSARSFGNIGTQLPSFDLGHTATHEIGHWLGLRHIWGDTLCGNDYCNDTPVQQQPSFGCPNYPTTSCSNFPYGDMFMNFMNYAEHPCMYLFTPDQALRMQTALQNGTYRSQLNASSATLCSIAAPAAAFSMPANSCADTLIKTQNQTYGNPSPGYVWSATPTAGVVFVPNNSSANPKIKFNIPGTYSVTLAAANSAGSTSLTSVITISNCALDVGIAETPDLKTHIHFSPNPTTGVINISTSFSQGQNLAVSVYNCLGQLVAESKYQQATQSSFHLDLSAYSNGVYLLTFSNGHSRLAERLVLSR